MSESTDKKRKPGEVYKYLTLVTQLGITMTVSIGGGLVVGLLLDKKLHTFPGFLIFFLCAGIGTGMYNVYKVIIKSIDNDEQDHSQD